MATSSKSIPGSSETTSKSSSQLLKVKALAYGFMALVFGALWLLTMVVPDPLPLIDEIISLLATAFTAREAVNAAK